MRAFEKMHVRRRSFVRGLSTLGLSALATRLWPLSAEAAGFPKRLVLLFQPNGNSPRDWWPTGDEFNWQLGKTFAGLAPYKNDVIFVDGVYKYGMRYDQPGGTGNEHFRGISQLWTGSKNDGWNTGTSIDQTIAAAIGTQTPFRSLQLGHNCGGASLNTRMIYAGPGKPMHPETNASAAFSRIFAGVKPKAADPTAANAELLVMKRERQAVIDAVKGDLTRAMPLVSREDRFKLEAHMDGLSELERRVRDAKAGVAPGCMPVAPAANMRAMSDIVSMAFACDLTRVASIQWGYANTDWPDNAHSVSHTNAPDALARIDAMFAAEVVHLIKRLKETPEGTGSMLDNTLVVFSNEIANTWGMTGEGKPDSHRMHRVPWLMAGGKNFAFKTGRYLRYGQPASPFDSDPKRHELMHARLLVSICNAFGLSQINTYGNLDPGQGPAPRL